MQGHNAQDVVRGELTKQQKTFIDTLIVQQFSEDYKKFKIAISEDPTSVEKQLKFYIFHINDAFTKPWLGRAYNYTYRYQSLYDCFSDPVEKMLGDEVACPLLARKYALTKINDYIVRIASKLGQDPSTLGWNFNAETLESHLATMAPPLCVIPDDLKDIKLLFFSFPTEKSHMHIAVSYLYAAMQQPNFSLSYVAFAQISNLVDPSNTMPLNMLMPMLIDYLDKEVIQPTLAKSGVSPAEIGWDPKHAMELVTLANNLPRVTDGAIKACSLPPESYFSSKTKTKYYDPWAEVPSLPPADKLSHTNSRKHNLEPTEYQRKHMPYNGRA